jgi:hypothetical protein
MQSLDPDRKLKFVSDGAFMEVRDSTPEEIAAAQR